MAAASVELLQTVVNVAITTPAVAGLLGWLGKSKLNKDLARHNVEMEKIKADYVQQLESFKDELDRSKRFLQAEIDRTILVTKVHFETEFSALKEVFAHLADLRLYFAELRPSFRVRPVNEAKDDKLKELNASVAQFGKAFNLALESSEHLSVFYPPEIYQQVRECLKKANMEIVDLQLAGPETFSMSWYQRGEANRTDFMTSFNAVSELIRERIAKLAVVHGT